MFSMLTTLLGFATESIVSLALIITVFVVEPMMTLFIAMMMGLTMLAVAKFVKPGLKREGESLQQNYVITNKWLLQAVNGIKEVKVTNKASFLRKATGRADDLS